MTVSECEKDGKRVDVVHPLRRDLFAYRYLLGSGRILNFRGIWPIKKNTKFVGIFFSKLMAAVCYANFALQSTKVDLSSLLWHLKDAPSSIGVCVLFDGGNEPTNTSRHFAFHW